jgi:SH3-like domain-containing protein
MLDILLDNPIILVVVVIVLLILIAIPVLIRRRRAAQEDVLPPPELGQSVDYTSLPYEEPTSLGDRLREAPIGVKLLLALVPIAVIVAAVVLWLTFFNNPGTGTAVVPTPTPPPTITNVTATVVRSTQIVVEANTNLPDTTQISAVMKENDQDLPWFNKDTISSKIADGRITLVLNKAKDAPNPSNNQEQFVTLIATVGDQVLSSEPAKITVPAIYKADFYPGSVATAPTAAPTTVPTSAPTLALPEPTAVPEPTATSTATLTATVFNGGNIRREPQVADNVVGQLHAGEVVTLLERSNDSTWYRVQAPEAEGWVSATLLTIDPAVASQVSTATPPETGLTATVFNGGNVRVRPVTGRPLDQINAGETVQLLAKTSDGGWYQITNIRNVTGWVSVTLLTIDPAVAQQVPIAK